MFGFIKNRNSENRFAISVNHILFDTPLSNKKIVKIAHEMEISGHSYSDKSKADRDSLVLQNKLNDLFGKNKFKVGVKEDIRFFAVELVVAMAISSIIILSFLKFMN